MGDLAVAQQRKYTMRRDHTGRRRRVATDLGHEGYYVTVTVECSGCTDIGDYGTKYGPFGCHECGHTGRRRERHFVPFDGAAYYGVLEASLRVSETKDSGNG